MEDPIQVFGQIYQQAVQAIPVDPNAMVVSTVGEGGRPSSRVLLLKGFDARGFTFYTNLQSRKGREMKANPWVALCFLWRPLEKQVRIEGKAEPVTDAEADEYFATRPRGSQVGAWASQVDFDPTSSNNPEVELDIYGGKHTDLWGVDWNFEPYYYSYPAEKYGAGPNADYFEIQNQFSKSFGPLALSGTWAWSDNFPFNGGTGNALYGNATYTILDWLSVSGNLGHQWAQNAKYAGSTSYTWGDFGATATYKGFALDLRYSGTDLSGAQCAAFWMATTHACSGGVVATLTYNITLLP